MSDLAIIAGSGALPGHVLAAHPGAVICEMEGFAPQLPVSAEVISFRLETLGSLIAALQTRNMRRLCLAGAIARVPVDPAQIDAATAPLVPRIMAALAQGGDDAALRAAIALFEDAGFQILGAHELCPDLLPAPGLLAGTLTSQIESDAARGHELLAQIAVADLGQGCVVAGGRVEAVEAAPGTDWMLHSLRHGEATGGTFCKAPKLGQERRVDLPAIGPETIRAAADAGLAAIALEAGGVMVLERDAVCALADAADIALWVRA